MNTPRTTAAPRTTHATLRPETWRTRDDAPINVRPYFDAGWRAYEDGYGTDTHYPAGSQRWLAYQAGWRAASRVA